jgi:hypothetical protein
MKQKEKEHMNAHFRLFFCQIKRQTCLELTLFGLLLLLAALCLEDLVRTA